MPLGREKDSSDRFHPATRKASTVLREEDCFHLPLLLLLRLRFLSAPPSYRQRFFLAFKTGSGARTMVFAVRATERSARKRSHRSRSNGGNRAVSSLPADHLARANFRAVPSSEAEAGFLPRDLHLEEFIATGSPAVASLVNRYDGMS